MQHVRKPAMPSTGRGLGLALRVTGLVVAVALLALVVLLSIDVGARSIPPGEVWHFLWHGGTSSDADVLRQVRIPRTMLGLVIGAALACAGVVMQALTRNPLADPGILGVNAGASAAVVLAIWLMHLSSLSTYVWFAFLGAALASVLIYLLGSQGRSGATPVRLALAGTAVSAALGAVITFVTVVSPKAFDRYRFWNVGDLTNVGGGVVWQVAPFVAVGALLAMAVSGSLNALALGEDTARALGCHVGRTRLVGALSVTLLCGAATAAAGPIGFVGLTVPHAVRVVAGPDHRWLVPYSVVVGAIVLLSSDVVGRMIARPGEIQVGIVTAVIGAPAFIALVRRRRIVEL